MNFENMFIMQGMLFALMLIGLLLKRTGLITDGNRGLLSGLVVNVTLPCSIIKSFEMEFDMEILRKLSGYFACGSGHSGGSLHPKPCAVSRTGAKAQEGASICDHLLQCGHTGKSHCRRNLWSAGAFIRLHYLIPREFSCGPWDSPILRSARTKRRWQKGLPHIPASLRRWWD